MGAHVGSVDPSAPVQRDVPRAPDRLLVSSEVDALEPHGDPSPCGRGLDTGDRGGDGNLVVLADRPVQHHFVSGVDAAQHFGPRESIVDRRCD